MKKHFNIAGPCLSEKHYIISPLERNIEIVKLVEQEHYFVIHASRQSGKTTILQHLVKKINSENDYYALYCSLETVQTMYLAEKGIPAIINRLQFMVKNSNLPHNKEFGKDINVNSVETALQDSISSYCRLLDRPLILFFDEADCLSEDTLITFLRQLRDGYVNRSMIPFLHSCALVGMRNIRDFKAKYSDPSKTLGSASPFNIITESLTITNFSKEMVSDLYSQHTKETGQVFEKEAIERAHFYSGGHPWLVNALARECVIKITKEDYSQSITSEMIEQAKENLILRRDTHIDSLLERLKEERVQKVIEPLITGREFAIDINTDNTQYCIDLGLLIRTKGQLLPANQIYREIIVRELSANYQFHLTDKIENIWIDSAGNINMNALLVAFQEFWRENSEIWTELYDYKEAAPHLILQAFLQRIVNGGGRILREYASGRGRLDLCVIYENNYYPIELKLYYDAKTQPKGIQQLAQYMDTMNLKTGWLIIFDRKSTKSWDEKIYWQTVHFEEKTIHVVGC